MTALLAILIALASAFLGFVAGWLMAVAHGQKQIDELTDELECAWVRKRGGNTQRKDAT